jgi:hypothetical protein
MTMKKRKTPTQRALEALQVYVARLEQQFLSTYHTKVASDASYDRARKLLGQSISLVRTAADHFEARGADATARHLRAEADRISPPDRAAGWEGRAMTDEEVLVENIKRKQGKGASL